MPIQCPCCQAVNDVGPACRRCKADLIDLFAVDARRTAAVTAAKSAAAAGDFDLSIAKLDEAEAHRAGADVRLLRAAVSLLNRDFTAAWKWYRAGTEPTTGRTR